MTDFWCIGQLENILVESFDKAICRVNAAFRDVLLNIIKILRGIWPENKPLHACFFRLASDLCRRRAKTFSPSIPCPRSSAAMR
jgi:hypothetical protein